MDGKIKELQDHFSLMDSFVLSNFVYCAIVWHFCNKKLRMRIERIFERGLRFVYSDYDADFTKILEKSNRSSMNVTRLKKIALFMFKCSRKVCKLSKCHC